MASWLRVSIVMLVAICGSGALAQAPAPVPTEAHGEYERIVTEALEEMQAGRFEEARSGFLRAHRLQPNARTLRALGNVEFELRHYAAAVRYFRAALAAQERMLTPEMRAEVQNGLARAEGYCAQLKPVLSPANATVTIDGEALALEPDGHVLLELGTHTIAASAPGHAQKREALTINGGERGDLAITLAPADEAADETSGPTLTGGGGEPYDDGGSVLEQWWFWTAVGVVAVGTTVAIVVATSGEEQEEPVRGNLGETRTLLSWTP